jgi:Zn-dependent protease
MTFDTLEILNKIGSQFVPFLFALCFHEFAHGWVAKLRGDSTAEMQGRLTMNPLAHMDFIGTFLLPMSVIIFGLPIFFGWAKPVPVNPRNLRNPRTDMFWVALAGPMSNVFLAIVAAFVIAGIAHLGAGLPYAKSAVMLLSTFILINLFLAFFNMIPLNPLDGGKVLARFLPAHINYKLEQNEQLTGIILLVLIFSGALAILRYPVMATYQFMMNLSLGGM